MGRHYKTKMSWKYNVAYKRKNYQILQYFHSQPLDEFLNKGCF